jgi:hypothetical protein
MVYTVDTCTLCETKISEWECASSSRPRGDECGARPVTSNGHVLAIQNICPISFCYSFSVQPGKHDQLPQQIIQINLEVIQLSNHFATSEMPNHTSTMDASSNGVSQLEDFIHRANKAKIETAENGCDHRDESWEVMDGAKVKQIARDAQDEDEWVLFGKTEAEDKRG